MGVGAALAFAEFALSFSVPNSAVKWMLSSLAVQTRKLHSRDEFPWMQAWAVIPALVLSPLGVG